MVNRFFEEKRVRLFEQWANSFIIFVSVRNHKRKTTRVQKKLIHVDLVSKSLIRRKYTCSNDNIIRLGQVSPIRKCNLFFASDSNSFVHIIVCYVQNSFSETVSVTYIKSGPVVSFSTTLQFLLDCQQADNTLFC